MCFRHTQLAIHSSLEVGAHSLCFHPLLLAYIFALNAAIWRAEQGNAWSAWLWVSPVAMDKSTGIWRRIRRLPLPLAPKQFTCPYVFGHTSMWPSTWHSGLDIQDGRVRGVHTQFRSSLQSSQWNVPINAHEKTLDVTKLKHGATVTIPLLYYRTSYSQWCSFNLWQHR